jgi:hypothetical protein
VWSNDVVIYCVQGVLTMELWNTMGMVAWMVSEDMEAGDEVVDETMAIVGVEGGMVVGICNMTLVVEGGMVVGICNKTLVVEGGMVVGICNMTLVVEGGMVVGICNKTLVVEGGMVVGICNRTLMVIITIGMTMWEGCLLHMAVVSFLKFYFIMFFIFYFESI